MDFSFVGGDAGLQRKQQQPPAGGGHEAGSGGGGTNGAPSAAAGTPGRIAIPSFRDVQQAERKQMAVPNMFKPSGVSGGSGSSAPAQQQQQQPGPPLQQPQQQPQQPQQGVNPFAFIGGPGSAPPPAAQQQHPRPPFQQGQDRPQGAPPYQQHQHQHQQHQAGQYRPQGPHYPQQQPVQAQQGQYRPPSQPGVRAASASQYPYWRQQQQQQQQQRQQQQQQPRPGFQQPPLQQQLPPPPQQQLQQLPANAIIVSRRQNGNPVLKYIRNVRWQFADNVVPDFLLGKETACLFLSLRYHLLKPEYIHSRIKELQRSFRLRIILCHVDTDDAVEPLAQVTRAAIGNDFTLICGWSNQECARYLETFKSYENKPAEVIQKDLGTDYLSRINVALTTVRGVNRTDVKTLGDRFGSVAGIFRASAEELQACPGIGPTKARRLHDTFHQPFRRAITATPPAAAAAAASPHGGGGGPAQQQQQQRHVAQQEGHEQAGVGALPPGLQEAGLDDEAEEGSGLGGEGSEDDDFV